MKFSSNQWVLYNWDEGIHWPGSDQCQSRKNSCDLLAKQRWYCSWVLEMMT